MQINNWNAIAAMSENRVIGNRGQLPWRIPEDMNWFKSATDGGVLVLGRKTLESMQTLHPRCTYLVLTRNKAYTPPAPNVHAIHSTDQIPANDPLGRSIWVCGGVTLYRETLPRCQYLYLTTLKQPYEGDAFFPPFEAYFHLEKTLQETDQIIIQRYKNRGTTDGR